jgi:hypothetical protein
MVIEVHPTGYQMSGIPLIVVIASHAASAFEVFYIRVISFITKGGIRYVRRPDADYSSYYLF